MSRFANSFILLAAGLALPLAALAPLPVAAQGGIGGAPLLLHGNYCGPGNNGPLAPIDALDAACARHDSCTPDGGLASRACNLRLQRDAERVASDRRQPEDLRALAGLVAAGAALMPSDDGRAPASLHAGLAEPRAVPPRALVPLPGADEPGDENEADNADAE